jgi:hypothetical protein
MRQDPTEPLQGDDIDIETWGHEFGYDDDADEDDSGFDPWDGLPYVGMDEDEVEDAEISAANWCECGLPREACYIHSKNKDA